MKFEKITGLIAATFSPFDQNDELKLDVVPAYFDFLIKQQVKGAFICGTTGEGSALTFEEKKALIEIWGPYNKRDFKIISMVSGTSQKEAISLAKISAESGLYGISMNAPYYFKPSSVDGLLDFMAPIAEAAPGLAVYFYHIPLLTNAYLPMLELLEKAGKRIPNFAGIKYTHNDLMDFNNCLRFEGAKYDILWGWDETFLAGLSMGAKGAVGSTYNFAAPLYHKVLAAFEKGDMETALLYQQKSIDFISLYGKFGGAAAGKAILQMCGVDCGDFRSPVKKLSDGEKKAFSNLLQDQNFFENTIENQMNT
ncbi:dihydrodipicolinate synthase family protein [Lunatibacter salilacus]|uniref:dihydrodipicolinate synthase family protein n=1 Tax=Lunatibacter salilacus TaxID=2483804 RepID=UPI00131B868A|nr:dihydrodipicolinate synthase family protein [Lunatibacter salilacus]